MVELRRWDNQHKIIEKNIVRDDVKGFKIGRTGDPDRRKREEKYDELIPLTGLLAWEAAEQFEGEIQAPYCNNPKYEGVCDSRGGYPKDGKQIVYLALFYTALSCRCPKYR